MSNPLTDFGESLREALLRKKKKKTLSRPLEATGWLRGVEKDRKGLAYL